MNKEDRGPRAWLSRCCPKDLDLLAAILVLQEDSLNNPAISIRQRIRLDSSTVDKHNHVQKKDAFRWQAHFQKLQENWSHASNARPELLPEVGAQRTLEAVRCSAWFGSKSSIHHFSVGFSTSSSLSTRQTLSFQVCVDGGRPQVGTCDNPVAAESRRRSQLLEDALAASRLKCGEVLTAMEQGIELIPVAIQPEHVAGIAGTALEELLIDGADGLTAVAQPATDEIQHALHLPRMLPRIGHTE